MCHQSKFCLLKMVLLPLDLIKLWQKYGAQTQISEIKGIEFYNIALFKNFGTHKQNQIKLVQVITIFIDYKSMLCRFNIVLDDF